MRASLLIILCLFGLGFTDQAAAQETPDEMKELRSGFEERLAQEEASVAELNDKYLMALQRLADTESQSGKLDRVLDVKKESEAFGVGKTYEKAAFQQRFSRNRNLRNLQETYLKSRDALDTKLATSRSKSTKHYLSELEALEGSLTRDQRISDALIVRAERESVTAKLSAGEVNSTASAAPMKARAHLVAKAEVELFLNGREVRLRNESDDRGYLDSTSSPLEITVGDVIAIRVRGEAVYRGMALGFELPDLDKRIQFPASAFRLIGTGEDVLPELVDESEFRKREKITISSSQPDPTMKSSWDPHGFSGSEFIQPPEKGEWAVFGTIISDEMLASSSK